MQSLLATFVVSFVPSWIWLLSNPECGPYKLFDSPYLATKANVEAEFIATVLRGTASPTVTWIVVLTMVAACFHFHRVRVKTDAAVQTKHSEMVLHRYDKTQLLRGRGAGALAG